MSHLKAGIEKNPLVYAMKTTLDLGVAALRAITQRSHVFKVYFQYQITKFVAVPIRYRDYVVEDNTRNIVIKLNPGLIVNPSLFSMSSHTYISSSTSRTRILISLETPS